MGAAGFPLGRLCATRGVAHDMERDAAFSRFVAGSLARYRCCDWGDVSAADGIGNHTNRWADYFVCRATVGGEGGTEKAVAGTTVEDADISFTVRFCRAAESVSSSGFSIVFREELYDILAIDHLNYKKRALEFRCRKVRR